MFSAPFDCESHRALTEQARSNIINRKVKYLRPSIDIKPLGKLTSAAQYITHPGMVMLILLLFAQAICAHVYGLNVPGNLVDQGLPTQSYATAETSFVSLSKRDDLDDKLLACAIDLPTSNPSTAALEALFPSEDFEKGSFDGKASVSEELATMHDQTDSDLQSWITRDQNHAKTLLDMKPSAPYLGPRHVIKGIDAIWDLNCPMQRRLNHNRPFTRDLGMEVIFDPDGKTLRSVGTRGVTSWTDRRIDAARFEGDPESFRAAYVSQWSLFVPGHRCCYGLKGYIFGQMTFRPPGLEVQVITNSLVDFTSPRAVEVCVPIAVNQGVATQIGPTVSNPCSVTSIQSRVY